MWIHVRKRGFSRCGSAAKVHVLLSSSIYFLSIYISLMLLLRWPLLAQTGEGIAECKLLRWFVAKVSARLCTVSVLPFCSVPSCL